MSLEAGEDFFANPDKQPRPYIRFQAKPKETRSAEGEVHYVDVDWVQVTPAGGKDVLEKPVVDWLRDLKLHAQSGRIPPDWPGQYDRAYKAWKEGQEIPVNGYPIKAWAPLTGAQRENILRTGIMTVEDLALANDEAAGRIGMGSRNLIDMAKSWVEDKKGAGALASRLEIAVQAKVEAEARITSLEEIIRNLWELIPTDKRPKSDPRPKAP